jgi:subtilase family protein
MAAARNGNDHDGGEGEPASWENEVGIVPGPGGYAFVPGELVVRTELAEPAIRLINRIAGENELGNSLGLYYEPIEAVDGGSLSLVREREQTTDMPRVVVPAVAPQLRVLGVPSHPNHVFFAHGCGCGGGCGPHPAARGAAGAFGHPVYPSPVYPSPVYPSPVYPSPVYPSPVYPSPVYPSGGGCGCGCGGAHPSPVYPSPVYPSPVYPSPVYPSPVYPSPVYPSPVYPSPVYPSAGTDYARTGRRRSSARPASATEAERLEAILAGLANPQSGQAPDVVVLDTGLALGGDAPPRFNQLVDMIRPHDASVDGDVADSDQDRHLDPAAGHGTFIAGLIQQVAPGAIVEVQKVMKPLGQGIERLIAQTIARLPAADPARGAVLNLSFGGQVLDDAPLLAAAIRTAQANNYVVVASAGNDATCAPTYPAAFADVVSVGAVGPHGPAPFSNYGPWVRACAPGVDLVSTFFGSFEGKDTGSAPSSPDPDDFAGWCRWSGSSFSAPLVAGALLRHVRVYGGTVQAAVEQMIDDPALMRIPDLGTVVNVI